MSIYDKASLVLIPSGTKTSKVYSQKPVSGDGDFTFSRSTAATRVNADGNIEKETQNLLLQSNTLDTTWFTNGPTLVGNQSGYDGSSDAWQITKSTAIAYSYIAQYVASSGVQTASFYAKAGSLSRIGILVGGGDNPYVSYDLSSGTILNQRASVIDSTITDVGGGWYRCTMTFNTTIGDLNIYPDWDQTNTGNLYLQDIQLEQGLVARDYIETTTAAIYGGITDNVPRLDYTDSSCPALLLEPQRTNLYQHSEYIFNFQGTETFNNANSPEGVSNAVLLTKTSASDQFVNMSWSGSSLSASTDYTMSLFVKHNGDDVDVRYEYNNSNDWGKGWYALFQVRASGVTASTTNLCTSDVEDYGNGWYRILVFVETASSITPSSPSNLLRVIGASGDEVLLYGAGMEQGSYATSYIPTYGSAVTRNADYMTTISLDTKSIIPNNDSWSAFFEVELLGNNSPNDKIQLSDNSNDPRAFLYANVAGVAGVGWTGTEALAMNTNNKIIYRGNSSTNITFFENGVNAETFSNTGNPLTFNRVNFYGNNGAFRLKRAILFPTALTDQEAIDLTTI